MRCMIIIIVCIIGTSLAAEESHESESYQVGKADAINDIDNGIYKIEKYGLSGDKRNAIERHYYRRILKEKYNITFNRVAGCRINREIRDHAQANNDTVYKEIKKNFGDNIFADAKIEARIMYKEYKTKKEQGQ